MIQDAIVLHVTRSEALVLFEWLASFNQDRASAVVGESEQKVLWSLEGQIESLLVEVLASNYAESLAEAKARVMGSGST